MEHRGVLKGSNSGHDNAQAARSHVRSFLTCLQFLTWYAFGQVVYLADVSIASDPALLPNVGSVATHDGFDHVIVILINLASYLVLILLLSIGYYKNAAASSKQEPALDVAAVQEPKADAEKV